MNWYERWFGEDYLLVYEHRDTREAELEIEAIEPILKFKKDELILDLCCGQGRHDLSLALRGCRIIGLDYSMPLLKLAQQTRPIGGMYPIYIRGDAAKIPFRDGVFDAVLSFFTSFGYFSDRENRNLLHSIARILKPGGRYYIDYLNPHRVTAELVEESTREKDGLKITEKRRIDHNARRIEKTILLRKDDHSQMFYESVRLYECEEMLEMLSDAGLSNISVLGSIRGEPYEDSSERMIFYGHKGAIAL